jgi:hypothetical protein
MGFDAVWDLSNLIKWAHRVTFVSYTSGWVGGYVLDCRGSVLGTGKHHVYNNVWDLRSLPSNESPCLSPKLANHKEDQSSPCSMLGVKPCVASPIPWRHALVINTVGWGTALQVEGRGFDSRWCHWNCSSTMAPGLTQRLTEMSTRNISLGLRRPVRRADNLTTFMCWLSWNREASISWNPQGLSRTVMGLLYLYLYTVCTGHVCGKS